MEENTVQELPQGAIKAQDICPLLWDLIEDTGAQGFINPESFVQHFVSCQRCQDGTVAWLRGVMAAHAGEVDLATRMMADMLMGKLVQLIKKLHTERER